MWFAIVQDHLIYHIFADRFLGMPPLPDFWWQMPEKSYLDWLRASPVLSPTDEFFSILENREGLFRLKVVAHFPRTLLSLPSAHRGRKRALDPREPLRVDSGNRIHWLSYLWPLFCFSKRWLFSPERLYIFI